MNWRPHHLLDFKSSKAADLAAEREPFDSGTCKVAQMRLRRAVLGIHKSEVTYRSKSIRRNVFLTNIFCLVLQSVAEFSCRRYARKKYLNCSRFRTVSHGGFPPRNESKTRRTSN